MISTGYVKGDHAYGTQDDRLTRRFRRFLFPPFCNRRPCFPYKMAWTGGLKFDLDGAGFGRYWFRVPADRTL